MFTGQRHADPEENVFLAASKTPQEKRVSTIMDKALLLAQTLHGLSAQEVEIFCLIMKHELDEMKKDVQVK